ncbi:hypothetical protein EBZ80_15455 [bacterium]|nr:hypothetical protein [bacterium]
MFCRAGSARSAKTQPHKASLHNDMIVLAETPFIEAFDVVSGERRHCLQISGRVTAHSADWHTVATHDGCNTLTVHQVDGGSVQIATPSENAVIANDGRWVVVRTELSDWAVYDSRSGHMLKKLAVPPEAGKLTSSLDSSLVIAWARDASAVCAWPVIMAADVADVTVLEVGEPVDDYVQTYLGTLFLPRGVPVDMAEVRVGSMTHVVTQALTVLTIHDIAGRREPISVCRADSRPCYPALTAEVAVLPLGERVDVIDLWSGVCVASWLCTHHYFDACSGRSLVVMIRATWAMPGIGEPAYIRWETRALPPSRQTILLLLLAANRSPPAGRISVHCIGHTMEMLGKLCF